MATLTPMTSPVFVPQPAVGNIRYGLLSVANGPLQMPAHGDVGGVQYLREHCGDAQLLAAASCSAPTITAGSTLDACDGTAIGLPFQVVAGLKAGTFPYNASEVERRARIRLADNTQFVAEQAFWGGNADVQPVLQRPELNSSGITDLTPTPGTPVTLEYGVGLLEDALAAYPYAGILHARPLVSPYLAERMLSPGPWRGPKGAAAVQFTPTGNMWSFGRGYSGNKPDNNATVPAAGTAYLVATGPVTVWRDDKVFVNPAGPGFDRTANNWQVTAQQAHVITIDCVAYFVLVGLDAMTTTTGAALTGRLY